ncbi:hypothetical protein L202_05632 [Cryptococcus amylolentus CBS 6039]|uniref:Uncharacterized protein n=1 Tax=Cryptococcus amylolentus CBS 6039 TaxID=1295533 RepID=A0A1E3HL67_9TREE|nr:hypothetical protein L202_05632 [Cryptococcus amylolentus CBS 6039]ODN77097.1 hypothetical protein L202_05632 [Cryptococcus amylolentus CBS 6039]
MSDLDQDYSVHIPDDSCVARTHFVISAKPYEELGYDDEPVTLWQPQLSCYKQYFCKSQTKTGTLERLNSESRQESLNNIEQLVNSCAAQAVYKEGIIVWDVERDEGSGEQESDDSSSSPADDDCKEEGSDATD